jgi:cytochrome c oxidase subunit IV
VSTVEHPVEAGIEPEVDHDSSHFADGPSDAVYLKIAGVLFVLTGMEVYASYADWLGNAFLPLLLILMAIKFILVVLFFMHLKFDAKIFGRLFWAGFFLAVTVYVAALATFKFFATT